MNESTIIPPTATTAPTTAPTACGCQAAPAPAAAKPSQPQPVCTPATPPLAQKGSKRQNRKQH
ncbi:MAG: hypothetical protein ABSG78_06270 [Verrucomicrobiota bacterium]